MSRKSARLKNREVQLTVRAAWEAAELRHDPYAQGKLLVDRVCDLIGGDFGFWCTIARFTPGAVPLFIFATPGSARPEELLEYFARSGRDFSPLEDPVMDLCRSMPRCGAYRMSDLMTQADPHTHGNTFDIMRRIGTRDALISIHRRADRQSVNCVSVHRTAIPRRHDARERALIELLTDELCHLYDTGRLEPPVDLLETLPPRLRQVALLLLTDRSAKQVARELRLSVETTRYYVKLLYRRLDVTSRQELMLKLASGRTAPRA